MATFAIGYEAFFYQDDLLSVSLMGDLDPIANILLGLVVFLLPLGFFLTVQKAQYWFVALVICYAFFCLLDVSRLTPYFVCYLSVFALFTHLKNNFWDLEKGLIALAVVVYFFSGLNKFNDHFADNILRLVWFYSLPLKPSQNIGYLVAASEMIFGLFLLFKKTRKIGCLALILMHAILLWKLSPFQQNWNPIVYPWNVAMVGILCFLFRSEVSFIKEKLSRPIKAIAIVLIALPTLSYFNMAPENLGYKLYTGNWYAPDFRIDDKIEVFNNYDKSLETDETLINPMFYSIQERALALSPEPWVYERIAENIELKFGTRVRIKQDHE